MENKRSKTEQKFNWTVLLIITLGGMVAGIYRNGVMSLFPFLQDEYQLTRAQVGLYSTFLYLSSILVAVFAGRIADKWGVKRSMLAGLGCMGFFILVHAFAPNFEILLVFATLTGLGLSIILPTTTKGIAEWFSSDNQATAMGIMTLGFALGGVSGASLLPWVAKNFGWKTSMIALSLIFFLISILFHYLYSNKNSDTKAKKTDYRSILKDIALLLKNKYLLTLCSLGIMFGVISGAIVTHFTLYLFMDFGLTEVMAGLGFMALQIGSMVGRPLWGFLNDKLFGSKEKVGFSVISVIISISSLVFAVLSNFNPSLVVIMSLGIILGSVGRGWQGLYFSAISEQVGEEDTGTGVGLSLVFVRAGIIAGPPIFGYIADRAGSYSYSWLLMAMFTIISVVISNYFLARYET